MNHNARGLDRGLCNTNGIPRYALRNRPVTSPTGNEQLTPVNSVPLQLQKYSPGVVSLQVPLFRHGR